MPNSTRPDFGWGALFSQRRNLMAKVTFHGGDPAIFGNIGFTSWPVGPPGNQTEIVFPLNKAVEVTDRHVLAKIRGMGEKSPFTVEDDPGANAEHGDNDEAASGRGSHGHGTLSPRKPIR
jgi:hypothetical protein